MKDSSLRNKLIYRSKNDTYNWEKSVFCKDLISAEGPHHYLCRVGRDNSLCLSVWVCGKK